MSGYGGENWIAAAKARPLSDVAEALGLVLLHRRYVCPSCHQEDNRRGSIVGSRQSYWMCSHTSCGAKGDTLDLVAWALLGRPSKGLDASGWAALRDWFGAPTPTTAHPTLAPAGPEYPPLALVTEAWEACLPICNTHQNAPSPEVKAVQEWLWHRKIDPWTVAALDMVRTAPRPKGGLWHGWPWIAALPVFDATGLMRSFRMRAVEPHDRKSLAPTGYSAAGLVLACPMAQGLLAGKQADICGFPWSGEVWIMEGEPDYLKMACTIAAGLRGKRTGPALFGFIGSGGLPPEIAARIPQAASVFLVPHQDRNGAGQEAAAKTCDRLRSVGITKILSVDMKGL